MNKLHCSANVSALSKKYDNILMWSYYNQHKGICIEYSMEHYYDARQKDINGTAYNVFPVIYTNDFDRLLPFIKNPDGMQIQIDGNFVNLLAVLKTKAWQHENEWRFFNWTKNIKSKFIKIPVSKVYCGVTISNNFKKKVIRAAKSITCPVVQMELSRDEFGLVEGETLYDGK